MTYPQLLSQLLQLGLIQLRDALEREIEIETDALRSIVAGGTNRNVARQSAEEFYCQDIAEFVERFEEGDYVTLCADDVLNYRRRATAWAIARKIVAARKTARST